MATGAQPTSWESFSVGPTWEYDETTGEDYLHLFSRRQPDLNRERPEVRHAIDEMMNWWIDRGIDAFQDIESINDAVAQRALGAPEDAILGVLSIASRVNGRGPMSWNDTEHAGFTSGTPWFSVNPHHAEITTETDLANPDSVFHHDRRLISLRHELEVIVHGDFQMLLEQDPTIHVPTHSFDDATLRVLGNVSSDEVPVTLPDAAEWARENLIIASCEPRDGEDGIVLRPWETRVYHRHP